jgi:hypothetical protein
MRYSCSCSAIRVFLKFCISLLVGLNRRIFASLIPGSWQAASRIPAVRRGFPWPRSLNSSCGSSSRAPCWYQWKPDTWRMLANSARCMYGAQKPVRKNRREWCMIAKSVHTCANHAYWRMFASFVHSTVRKSLR